MAAAGKLEAAAPRLSTYQTATADLVRARLEALGPAAEIDAAPDWAEEELVDIDAGTWEDDGDAPPTLYVERQTASEPVQAGITPGRRRRCPGRSGDAGVGAVAVGGSVPVAPSLTEQRRRMVRELFEQRGRLAVPDLDELYRSADWWQLGAATGWPQLEVRY